LSPSNDRIQAPAFRDKIRARGKTMSLTQLAPPYPIFTDKNGDPLDAGFLYFGVADQNPETNPITVYFDNALTQPAAQPIRTINGYPSRNGSPAAIYTDQYFSVTVRNKKNELVIYAPSGYGVTPGTSASFTDQITYNEGSVDAIDRVLTSRLQDYVSAKDFGAIGDGVTDDTVALQAALNAASGQSLFIPEGEYIVSETLYIPAGTRIFGAGKYDWWDQQDYGTRIITSGSGNPQRWTDIDGTDPADDTPLFVAVGNGVYVDNITLLTGEAGAPAWSMGLFFPCVKQCGFSRFQAFGFTDGCVYLDATWSNLNTTLKSLHPQIEPSTGMTEFFGQDFHLRPDTNGFGIKIQGTTRDPDAFSTPNFVWGWGGASDTVFLKGRVSNISIDGAVQNAAKALQGIRFVQVDIRSGVLTDMLYIDRGNRIEFFGGYGEAAASSTARVSFTTRTGSVLFVGGRYIRNSVFFDGVDQSFPLKPDAGRNLSGRLSFLDYEGDFMNAAGVWGSVIAPHADGGGSLGSSSNNFGGVRARLLRNDTGTLNLRGQTGVSVSVVNADNRILVDGTETAVFPNGSDVRFRVQNTAVICGQTTRPTVDNLYDLGASSFRWAQVRAANGTINTSDAREKQDILELDETERRVAIAVKGLIRKYRWKDAIEKKGDDARWHFGVMAQDVIAAFEAEGLDAMRYGVVCYDEWKDEIGPEGDVVTPAGNRYGVRYNELFAFVLGAL